MKPIRISPENGEKIIAALAAVNGRAQSFTVQNYSEVDRIMCRMEARLAPLPKADRAGATATYTPAGPSANAYKYAAKSTLLRMERRATGWFLTGIEPTEVYPRAGERISVTISEAQRDEIARRAVADFAVARAKATAQ
jgi:hypothetical protein